jgi:hypothetical protein
MKLKRLMAVLAVVTVFALILTVMPAAIFADTVTFWDDLTSGKTFIRCLRDSGDFSYYTQGIIPDSSESYTIEVVDTSPPGLDTYLYLYENCFDPNNPCNNLLTFDDDSGSGHMYWSKIDNYPLVAGKKYVVVVTTWAPGDTGTVQCDVSACTGSVSFTDDVGCPAPAAPAAEPEPEPWIRGDRHMMCSTVFVNEDGCFEFAFIYEYADNNWVSIFNKDTKELAHQVNMPYGKANFEACLENNITYVVFTHRAPMGTYDELAEEDNHFQMFEVSNITDSM